MPCCDTLHALLRCQSVRPLGQRSRQPHHTAVLGSGTALHTLSHVQGQRALRGAKAAPCPGISAVHRPVTPALLTPCPCQACARLPPSSATGLSARGRFKAAQSCPVPRVKCPGPKPGSCRRQARPPHCTYLRLPGQTAVPGLVGREGTLHHTAVPKVVIVTKDLQQRKEQDGHESPVSPIPCPPPPAVPSPGAATGRLGHPLQSSCWYTVQETLQQLVTRQLGRPWVH